MENKEKNLTIEEVKQKKAVKRTVIILAFIAFIIYVISVYQTLAGH
jgi:hypothetical protein